MAYLTTEYEAFFNDRLMETASNDADKINCIRLKMNELKRKLVVEKSQSHKSINYQLVLPEV